MACGARPSTAISEEPGAESAFDDGAGHHPGQTEQIKSNRAGECSHRCRGCFRYGPASASSAPWQLLRRLQRGSWALTRTGRAVQESRCLEQLKRAAEVGTCGRLRDTRENLGDHLRKREELNGVATQRLAEPVMGFPFGAVAREMRDCGDIGERARPGLAKDRFAKCLAPLRHHEFTKETPGLTAGANLVL